VAGQVLGGLLISANLAGTTWRPVFLVNVPVGLVLLWLAWRRLPAGTRPTVSQRPDVHGTAVLSAALLLLVVPLIFGPDSGWPVWSWVCLAASVPAFGVVWVTEKRVARDGGRPLVDPRLLARPAVSWGLASEFAATGTYFGVLFTLALYLQSGLGKSAAYSGLALVAWVAAFGVPGPVLGRLPDRARVLAAPAGSLLLAAAYAAIGATLFTGDTSGALLICLLGVAGLGLGIAFTGMLGHLAAVGGTDRAADISGLLNTGTRIGGVIGTAVFGAAYLAMAHHPVHGFAILNVALAATALAAAAMAVLSVRDRIA
jgi:predicted MFS family arabinose efflux permease